MVELWRRRGPNSLPLSVDATAAFVELSLLDMTSDYASRLTYAMAITRLVNGVVDPLQQGARATSVKRLAQTVGLPATLVELRHECTHNALPSLGRMQLAADQALLWLHGHYWLPQKAIHDAGLVSLHSGLQAFCRDTAVRCAQGDPPLRKHVVACAQAVERAVLPSHLGTHLIPTLLDEGYLIPVIEGKTTGHEDAIAAAQATATGAGESDPSLESVRMQWAPLLARLDRLWPAHGFASKFLLGVLQRLHDEAERAPPPTVASASTARLFALQGWALHLVDSDGNASGDGGTATSLLSVAALEQAAWLATRAAQGWGRAFVRRVALHPGWSDAELSTSAKRLMKLHDLAQRVRRGEDATGTGTGAASTEKASTPGPQPTSGARGLHPVADLPSVATRLAPPIAAGSPWRACQLWAPCAIGAAPPQRSLSALKALASAEGGGIADASSEGHVLDDAIATSGEARSTEAEREGGVPPQTSAGGLNLKDDVNPPKLQLLYRRKAEDGLPEAPPAGEAPLALESPIESAPVRKRRAADSKGGQGGVQGHEKKRRK